MIRPRVLIGGAALLILFLRSWGSGSVAAALVIVAAMAEVSRHGTQRPLVLIAAALVMFLVVAAGVHQLFFPWTTVTAK